MKKVISIIICAAMLLGAMTAFASQSASISFNENSGLLKVTTYDAGYKNVSAVVTEKSIASLSDIDFSTREGVVYTTCGHTYADAQGKTSFSATIELPVGTASGEYNLFVDVDGEDAVYSKTFNYEGIPYEGYDFTFDSEDLAAAAPSEVVDMDFADGTYDTTFFNSPKNSPTFTPDAQANGDGYMDLSGSTENGIWKTTTTGTPEAAIIEFDADISDGLVSQSDTSATYTNGNTKGFHVLYTNAVTGARLWIFFSAEDGALRDVAATSTAIWAPANGASDLSGKKHYRFVLDGNDVTFYFNNETVGTAFTIGTRAANKGNVRIGAAANKGAKIYSFSINGYSDLWTRTSAVQESGVVTLSSGGTSSARIAKNNQLQVLNIPSRYSFETSIKYKTISPDALSDFATGNDVKNMSFVFASNASTNYRVWITHDKNAVYYASTARGGFWNKIADYPLEADKTYIYRVDVDGRFAQLYINGTAVGSRMTLTEAASYAGYMQLATRGGAESVESSLEVSYIRFTPLDNLEANIPAIWGSITDSVTAEIDMEAANDSACLILVAYNSNGEIVNTAMNDTAFDGEETLNVTLSGLDSTVAYVTLFTWAGKNNIRPIINTYTWR